MARSATAFLLICAFACKATPPGRIERALAAEVKHHVTVGGRAERNPIPVTAESIRDGEAAFVANCSMCHGLDGRNTGVAFARTMSPPVPELVSPEVQQYTDGQLHAIIADGLSPSGMPASREILDDADIWRIVAYIRQLGKTANKTPTEEYLTARRQSNAPGTATSSGAGSAAGGSRATTRRAAR